VFNKSIAENRFIEIKNKLDSFNWYPNFTNAIDLKGNKEWYETNIPKIQRKDPKEAWSKMPKKMEDYLKSLEEYDQEIFDYVTYRK